MPHMANLPWIQTYILMFFYILIQFSAMKQLPHTKKSQKKNNIKPFFLIWSC